LVEAVDNILDLTYFREFFPALAAKRLPLQLFYEVKSNLTREQIRMLSAAGVNRVQPGIESLSDHVLQLMRKGTTGLRNIQTLKWCHEYGVGADWNLLYGFPGETAADYQETLKLLPAIRFLGAPVAWGPVRMDRFSPYFETPGEFGMRDLRPFAPYFHLYPFREESVSRIAYYFEYKYDPAVDPTGFADPVVRVLEQWKRQPETGTLCCYYEGDTLVLSDSRSDATAPEFRLTGMEREVYEYCDEYRPGMTIVRRLRARFSGTVFEDAQVYTFLDSMVANRLMVTDGRHYLALAVRLPQSNDRREQAISEMAAEPAPVGAGSEFRVLQL
jgi:ribosomal peptide maturation radical SAM protein 1